MLQFFRNAKKKKKLGLEFHLPMLKQIGVQSQDFSVAVRCSHQELFVSPQYGSLISSPGNCCFNWVFLSFF